MRHFLENNGDSWPDCTLADLDSAVLDMLEDEDQFVVLSPESPVGGSRVRFMQAAQYPEGIKVEFSLRYGGQWRIFFRYYKRGGEVMRLFEDFFQNGATPDWADYQLDETIYPE